MLHHVKLKIMGYCVCPVTLNWTLLCKFIQWCKFSSHIKMKLRERKLHKKRPAFIQVCIKWCTNNMFSPKCVNLNCHSHDTSMSVSFLLHLHGWEFMPQFTLLAACYREDILMSKNVLFHSCLDFILFFLSLSDLSDQYVDVCYVEEWIVWKIYEFSSPILNKTWKCRAYR